MMITRENILKQKNWKPLGEVVEFLDHKRRPITENERVGGEYPYYGANGQQGTINDYIFDEPLILLAEDGGFFGMEGKPISYTVEGKTWVNNHAHVLKPKPGYNLNYIFRHLQFYDVSPFINGTTRSKLTKSSAEEIPIYIVGDETKQNQVANLIDKADSIRKKRQQQIKLTDEFLRSTFLEMFGDPKKIKTGLLGSDLFVFSSGKFNPTSNLNNYYEFPTYGGNGITGYSKEYLIDFNTIVIGRVGAYCGSIHKAIGKSWVTDNAIYIKEFRMEMDLDYLKFLFEFLRLNRFANFSGQPKITQAPVEELIYPEIPFTQQKKFGDTVRNIEIINQKLLKTSSESENLFNSLMQKVFKGEL